jgi:hypothetical protein
MYSSYLPHPTDPTAPTAPTDPTILLGRNRATQPTTWEKRHGFTRHCAPIQPLQPRTPYCAPTPKPAANARANPTRSYHYSTVSESLSIEYGPSIFANLGKPRPGQRFGK